jgi:hypothetical protein
MQTNHACENRVQEKLKQLLLPPLESEELAIVVAMCSLPPGAGDLVAAFIVANRQVGALRSDAEFANLSEEERSVALAAFVSGKSLPAVKSIVRAARAKAVVSTQAPSNRRPAEPS